MFQSLESHAEDDLAGFLTLMVVRRLISDFFELSPDRITSRTEMGKERSIRLYCGR